ncbi:MAG: aldehyde ferredoxin oxidoreductase family protein [Firmicutes bacterium]|nr:aldehyde ferredoxin oxidoreductase family protein [Bacillota bacterium]MDH7494782.1 aldehyde ferredoxin oxidoreductase family protein [Bacillota bacterium]
MSSGCDIIVLRVDLSQRCTSVERLPLQDAVRFLGGRGLASRILFSETGRGSDPLGDEAVLVFAPGHLTGTCAPTAGRTTVVGKSPATGLFMKSSMGGHWGAGLKFAGYDILVVRGTASRPTYLLITDTVVQFGDASHYWGLDVRETSRRMAKELAMPDVDVACIGPSGENNVKLAGIMCTYYHAAARGGLGAALGAKNLKAIAVRGHTPMRLADPARFWDVSEQVRRRIVATGRCKFYGKYGTAGVVVGTNEMEALPVQNFRRGYMENAYSISGQCLTEKGYLVRRESCFACPIACKRYSAAREKHPGSEAGGPEYETVAAFGAGCLLEDMDDNLRANELCNILGLDSISTASVIQWAFESAERGVVPEYVDDGRGGRIRLAWGDADAVLALIEMIAYRRGFGDVLADGVRAAAQKVGGDSWRWAVEAKGLEQSRVETRMAKAYALAFATNPRGPDHLYGQPMAEFGFSPEARDLVRRLTGDAKYADPVITDHKPKLVAWHEECFAMTDSLGLCSRATLSTYAITPAMMAEMLSAATGLEVTEDEMHQAARRVINLERAFNAREGAGRKDDRLPWRLMHEELPNSRGIKAVNSEEELGTMLDEYYDIRGWDRDKGIPKASTLVSLGLGDVASALRTATAAREPSQAGKP